MYVLSAHYACFLRWLFQRDKIDFRISSLRSVVLSVVCQPNSYSSHRPVPATAFSAHKSIKIRLSAGPRSYESTIAAYGVAVVSEDFENQFLDSFTQIHSV